MGSLFIVISIPSALHEKSLWIEKNLGHVPSEKKSARRMKPIKSAGNFFGSTETVSGSMNSWMKSKSVSDDSVLDRKCENPEQKKRTLSAIYTSKNRDKLPMEQRLEKCLKELEIPNAVWVLGRAEKYYQVSFCAQAGEECDRIIQMLNENEIGIELNSTVSILPCTLYYEGKEYSLTSNKASPTKPLASDTFQQCEKEETAWQQFVNSVRARLMVAQVVAGVKSNAVFTFDFLILLIIASLTAAIGLVENSIVALVASMLISPLMGPVMASTFGFVTKDWKLQNIGVMNELLGLLLCVLIGFLYGLLIGFLHLESLDLVWPTPEMISRGEMRSLWLGALIALLSGAAVAIAVLGNYSGSLTGVAISASLMPPAVNAGLVWSVAALNLLLDGGDPRRLTGLKGDNPLLDLLVLGFLSLFLTFINIICIFVMGILVLKIKEVTPQGCKQYSKLLWDETMQIVQNAQKHVERMEQGLSPENFAPKPYGMHHHQHTWTAYGAMQELNRPSIYDLTSMYQNMTLHPGTANRIFPGRFSSQVNVRRQNEMSTPDTVTSNENTPILNINVRRFTITPTPSDSSHVPQ